MDEVVQTPSPTVAKSTPIGGSDASPSNSPKFPMPNFEFQKFEIPAAFRDFAEKSASQAKEACERMKSTTNEMTDRFEEAYTTATGGANDYGLQLLEASRAHANAAFDYATKALAVKSLSELIELSTAHVREQLDVLTEQSKKLTSLVQKVAHETAEPIKEGATKVFRRAA